MGVSDRGDNFQESYPLKSVDLVRNDATYPAIPGEHLEGRPADDTEMNPGRGERSWSKVWYDFSQKTTLHGISQITETTPFAVRRVLWLLIVLLGLTLFGRQMVQSVAYYLQRPVTVNVKINYNTTLTFPAITICNQNDFRTTATAEHNLYHLVQEYYRNMNKRKTDLSRFGATNLSLADLYRWAAHRKEDMIVSCMWDEMGCNATDFEASLTDYGMCYTFNKDDGKTKLRTVERTGADRGLRLRLNIEQYEYMLGPNPGAGIKILIHENKEVPLVRDLGHAIPPGTHAYVAIQITEVKNLKRPHGVCNDSVQLQYFPYYSIPACILDCKERFLLQRCGCRDVYMPEPRPGQPAQEVCTLEEYQDCALPMIEKEFYKPRADGTERCQCPIPCVRRLFDPTISYAHTSFYDTEHFLMADNFQKVKQRFLYARDVVQHVDDRVLENDRRLIADLTASVSTIEDLMLKLERGIAVFHQEIRDVTGDIESRMLFHKTWGVDKVRFTVHHDFTRGWEVMEERTFDHLTTNYLEITAFIGRVIELANASPEDDKSYHQTLYVAAEHDLYQKKIICDRAIDNLTKVREGYLTATRLLTYKASPKRRYDETWVAPSLIILDKVKLEQFSERLITRTHQYCEAIDAMREFIQQISISGRANMTDYDERKLAIVKAAKSYNYYRFRFYDVIVLNPEKAADALIETFTQDNKTMLSDLNYLNIAVGEFEEFLLTALPAWTHIMEVSTAADDYISNRTTKLTLASALLAKNTTENRQTLLIFFEEARLRARHISELLNHLHLSVNQVWRRMIDDVTTKPLYHKLYDDITNSINNSTVLDSLASTFAYMLKTNSSWVKNNTYELYRQMNADFAVTSGEIKAREDNEKFARLANMADFTYFIKDNDAIFFRALDRLTENARTFFDSNKMDHEFFKNNFLSVDIFMKELNYEEIEQQVAYDMTSLWSDIGGSMGLFIGASVITVFEVFDVIIHNIMKIYCLGSKR